MCDYSLYTIPNRLAQEGEDLVLHKFATGTLGFASVSDLKLGEQPKTEPVGFWSNLKAMLSLRPCPTVPAVCIPPGARLVVTEVPKKVQSCLQISAMETATFTEISSRKYSYRDALVFPGGKRVLLQRLPEGIRAHVLALATESSPLEQVEEDVYQMSSS